MYLCTLASVGSAVPAWALTLWLELKVDLELHEPVVDLVSFTVEQVWLGDANLSIWEVGVGCS